MENFFVGLIFVGVLIFIGFLLIVIFTDEQNELAADSLYRRARRAADITGMNSKMWLSVGLFAFTALFVGYYALTEDARRAAAEGYQLRRAQDRAAHTYASNCASCHGDQGQGLVGPALRDPNAIAQRHGYDLTNPVDVRRMEDFLRNTITFGWPPVYRGGEKPRMPNWGDRAGGTLNDEQIFELVTLIQRNEDRYWEEVEKLVHEHGGAAAPPADPSTPEGLGRSLYTEKGCVSCHGRSLEGGIGPALTRWNSRQQIAGVLPNDTENLKRWLANPPAVKPGTAMPNLNLKPEEIDALTAYLQSQ